MNNKTRKQRQWKSRFRKEFRQRILDTVELECGLPASCLCVFIAKMAERLSGRKLKTQNGILVIHDLGVSGPPLSTAHCWNTIGNQIFDLSLLADCPHRIQYLTERDGEEYRFYRDQTVMFEEVDEDDLEADLIQLMNAFHGGSHDGVSALLKAFPDFEVQSVGGGATILTRIPEVPSSIS